MPGIAGFVTKMPRDRAERQLQAMMAAVTHDRSFKTGRYIDESIGLYLGWAVPATVHADDLPFFNERNDVALVIAGEEFPAPGVSDCLRRKGHTVPQSGRSYLVHVYEEDSKFPESLNGTFHGMVVDSRRRLATLFNDRYGMRRVYYHEASDGVYFAAEAKAILAVRPDLRRLDPRGFGELMTCGCVLENRSIFEGIHVLPPGSAWTFRDGGLESKHTYFDPADWENQSLLDPETYYQEVRQVFARNLDRYFEGVQKPGISLTGGLDTRMIMAWRKQAPGSLECYSFAGSYRDSHDVRLAREVAAACGQPHQDIQVDSDFLKRFPELAERTVSLADGSVEVSCAPVLYCCERAREISPVRMTGNYGGEVLRRVVAFKPGEPMPGLMNGDLTPFVQMAHQTYSHVLQTHPLSFAVFRQAPWHHYGLFALEQTQLSVRSPFLDNEFVKTVFRAPASACTNNDVCLRLIGDGNPALLRIRTDRGLAGTYSGLLAAASRSILEFSFKAEYAYDHGMPQWLARMDHALAPMRLERLFLGRHKYYHFRIWYRTVLADYIRDVLLDSRTLSRPLFDRRTIEAVVNGHLRGNRNYTFEIHKLLTLELLHRTVLDRN
jgi:asparagine synthase (glutamine-hydrolysing)